MSAEPATPSPLWDTLTFRTGRTFAGRGAVGVCGLLYFLDKYQGWFEFAHRREAAYRMFKSPSEPPMRIFGLPHFIIATIFVCSSRRMKETRNKLIFASLFLVGMAFCVGFYKMGAHTNPLANLSFYFYFLIHGLRDDAFFYKAYGDMPTEAVRTHERIMAVLQLLLLGLLFSLIWPTYIQMGDVNYRPANPVLDNFFPANWPFISASVRCSPDAGHLCFRPRGRRASRRPRRSLAGSSPDPCGLWHFLTVILIASSAGRRSTSSCSAILSVGTSSRST